MDFTFGSTDLRAQVGLVVDEFASWLSQRGLSVSYGEVAAVEPAAADPGRIRQVTSRRNRSRTFDLPRNHHRSQGTHLDGKCS